MKLRRQKKNVKKKNETAFKQREERKNKQKTKKRAQNETVNLKKTIECKLYDQENSSGTDLRCNDLLTMVNGRYLPRLGQIEWQERQREQRKSNTNIIVRRKSC
jgi:hypothetical protein